MRWKLRLDRKCTFFPSYESSIGPFERSRRDLQFETVFLGSFFQKKSELFLHKLVKHSITILMMMSLLMVYRKCRKGNGGKGVELPTCMVASRILMLAMMLSRQMGKTISTLLI